VTYLDVEFGVAGDVLGLARVFAGVLAVAVENDERVQTVLFLHVVLVAVNL
jgi:hypothetical protein